MPAAIAAIDATESLPAFATLTTVQAQALIDLTGEEALRSGRTLLRAMPGGIALDVRPLALASLARAVDWDVGAIALFDEAQFEDRALFLTQTCTPEQAVRLRLLPAALCEAGSWPEARQAS